jgi:hypothetical protein
MGFEIAAEVVAEEVLADAAFDRDRRGDRRRLRVGGADRMAAGRR